MKLDNDARLLHDFSQYRAMLKELRCSEESFEDGSKIAYLLQVGKHTDSVICKMFRHCKLHLLAWLVNVELEAYVVGLDHNFTPVRACWVRRPVTSNHQWSEFSLPKRPLPFF